ncbi:MAG: Gfo/Idh/MocA family protein, partial [Phycisphaerae bacterium]
ELVEAARSRGVWLAVNHLLRHSGLLGTVKRLIDSGLLGEPLRAVLENYAEDERVPADHWFWDERKSGGIFIEHGVHFFDLYRWWFGRGSVLAARLHRRPGTAQADRAWCVVEYDNGVVGQFYHGFDQTYRLDRAEHRIVFERGDVRVIGWVPMELQVYGIVDDRQRQELQALCSQANLELLEHYGPQQQLCHGRGKTYRVTCRLLLRQVLPAERRGQVYSEMFESLLGDQLERLEDERHRPAVTAEDAREAVGLAAAATDLARR